MAERSIANFQNSDYRNPDFSILDFLKTFGIGTTTNFHLYRIAKMLGLDIKVLMRNELDEYLKLDTFRPEVPPIPIIFNYQTSTQNGTHWLLYWNGLYFDSFGLPPIKELEEKVKEYNEVQVQPFGSRICGQLCLYVLYKLENGSDFDDIIFELFETFKGML